MLSLDSIDQTAKTVGMVLPKEAQAARRKVLPDKRIADIRVGLKSLYDRQFNHPVDESPFVTIDTAGMLRSHAAPEKPAAW